jgi:mannose/fructose-specific phosphotransferase system component IIA
MKNKRRKFLIATHGALAEGFRSSLDMIAGVTEDIYLLQAYIDKSKPVDEELADLFRGAGEEAGVAGEEEEWVVFSDLLGGSITNQLLRAASQRVSGAGGARGAGGTGGAGGAAIHIVAGFNLPLLIEVVLADPATPVEEILEAAIGRAREQMVYVNKLITQKNNEGEDA